MKKITFIMMLITYAYAAPAKTCMHKINGQQVAIEIKDGTSCKNAITDVDVWVAEQKRINDCIVAGGDEDACWLNTTTYEESSESCTTDMDCVEKYRHDCYIVRDVIGAAGDEYML